LDQERAGIPALQFSRSREGYGRVVTGMPGGQFEALPCAASGL
jgi:hypothetical protein